MKKTPRSFSSAIRLRSPPSFGSCRSARRSRLAPAPSEPRRSSRPRQERTRASPAVFSPPQPRARLQISYAAQRPDPLPRAFDAVRESPRGEIRSACREIRRFEASIELAQVGEAPRVASGAPATTAASTRSWCGRGISLPKATIRSSSSSTAGPTSTPSAPARPATSSISGSPITGSSSCAPTTAKRAARPRLGAIDRGEIRRGPARRSDRGAAGVGEKGARDRSQPRRRDGS